jgi:hypothetical protein
MRSRETGALLFLAKDGRIWQPHHCRIKASRYSLVAMVSRATCFVWFCGTVGESCVVMMWGGGMHAREECGVFSTLRLIVLSAGNGIGPSKAVDIFNAITGNWSTAVLSEARMSLAATSLPNQGLAIFAGGAGAFYDCCCSYYIEACGVRYCGYLVC